MLMINGRKQIFLCQPNWYIIPSSEQESLNDKKNKNKMRLLQSTQRSDPSGCTSLTTINKAGCLGSHCVVSGSQWYQTEVVLGSCWSVSITLTISDIMCNIILSATVTGGAKVMRLWVRVQMKPGRDLKTPLKNTKPKHNSKEQMWGEPGDCFQSVPAACRWVWSCD